MTPHKLAISSVRKDGKHYFLGDFDDHEPTIRAGEWLIESSKGHYHVLDFRCSFSLQQLIDILALRFADSAFIRTVQKHKFAQLTLRGKILQHGFIPDPLFVRLVSYVE